MFGSKLYTTYRLMAWLCLVFILSLLSPVVAAAEPGFVNNNFQQKWQRADKAVADGVSNPPRSWLWGPEGFNPASGITEPYAESPGGARQVQYFDKARMELNNPASGLVTNGLLVRELISGRLATGDTAYIQRRVALDIPIAGDALNNVGPTYASFSHIASLNLDNPSSPRIGAPVNDTINQAGIVGTSPDLGRLTKYAYFDSTLKHNIPDVFWYFMNQRGNIYQNGQYQNGQAVLGTNPVAPWLDAVGYPLTEAYWAKVTVAGQVKDVLIQAFERRILTYTPSNPAAFQVEMGNVGRHYFAWRYNHKYDLGSGPALFTGVNLAGAEFAPDNLPGVYGDDYVYPSQSEIDYFVGKGMNTLRLPFAWERLQPAAFGAFNQEQQSRIDSFVNYATGKGAYVILDPHNYASYYGKTIGKEVPVGAFTDLWAKLAGRYKDNARVIFGLMNEPTSIQTGTWVSAANAAIKAIRASGANNLILVPGSSVTDYYLATQKWLNNSYGQTMLGIVDPNNNYAYEFHQYLDGNSSGTSGTCVSKTIGSERLKDFTGWLKQNNRHGFLGEFGAGRNDTCYAALDDMLNYLDSTNDVWLGWTYWAAGPLWGDYNFTLEPSGGKDRPQLAVLGKHLFGTSQGGIPIVRPVIGPPAPVAVTTPPASVPSAANYSLNYDVPGHWQTGYNISVTVSNNGSSQVNGWTVSWELAYGETLTTTWNADCKISGNIITCTNMPYNSSLGANGGNENFGAQFATKNGNYSQPTAFTINGVAVNA